MQAKSHLCLAVLTGEKRAVATGRRPNTDYRKREHLTETEIEKLIGARTARRICKTPRSTGYCCRETVAAA